MSMMSKRLQLEYHLDQPSLMILFYILTAQYMKGIDTKGIPSLVCSHSSSFRVLRPDALKTMPASFTHLCIQAVHFLSPHRLHTLRNHFRETPEKKSTLVKYYRETFSRQRRPDTFLKKHLRKCCAHRGAEGQRAKRR